MAKFWPVRNGSRRGVRVAQIRPSAFMLLRPWLPTMTWSWTVTRMWRPASIRSLGQADVLLARARVAAGMVVDDDDRGRAKRDGAGDDFADMDRGLVDRSGPQRLIGEEEVLGVEEQDADLLDRQMGHGRGEIIAKRVPARQHRPVLDPRFEQAARGRLGDLERGDHAVGQALAAQRLVRRCRASAQCPPNWWSSALACALVSRRGMARASRYSTSS